MRVEEIKAAIEEFPGGEFVEIRKWVASKFWSARVWRSTTGHLQSKTNLISSGYVSGLTMHTKGCQSSRAEALAQVSQREHYLFLNNTVSIEF